MSLNEIAMWYGCMLCNRKRIGDDRRYDTQRRGKESKFVRYHIDTLMLESWTLHELLSCVSFDGFKVMICMPVLLDS